MKRDRISFRGPRRPQVNADPNGLSAMLESLAADLAAMVAGATTEEMRSLMASTASDMAEAALRMARVLEEELKPPAGGGGGGGVIV